MRIMNKYILMTMGISGMGGGQMYIRNKMLYMENKGWKTFVYAGLSGEIVIPELKQFSSGIDPILTSSPFVYSKKFVKYYVKKILRDCDITDKDNVIVETGTAHMSYWGELIAKECNGRHICFLLDERNDLLVRKEYIPFFYYKYGRGELVGINGKALPLLFRGYKNCCEKEGPALPALCQNVVEDCAIPSNINLNKADYTFGSIGRLEKPYVPYMIEQIVEYVKKHQNKTFNLLLIGGTNDVNRIDEIKKATEDINNLNVVITGYLFPIPLRIFPMVDLFISSAGSAGVSYGQNIPTIALDAADEKPIGILGYTTSHSLYRDGEEIIELAEWLRLIIEEDLLSQHSYKPKKNNNFELLKKHDEFLLACNKEKDYYDVLSIRPAGKDMVKKIATLLIGNMNMVKLKDRINNYRMKSNE